MSILLILSLILAIVTLKRHSAWTGTPSKIFFTFKPNEGNETIYTKRVILSTISSIFDPLGLVGPVVVKSKIILQHLWQQKILWDDVIFPELQQLWIFYQHDLSDVANLKIPRHVLCNKPVSIQMHAFSDASEVAYGTCVYLRSTDSTGRHAVHLLCSKGRVAPLKVTTIPRLKLMAAHLAAKLVAQLCETLSIHINH